MTLSQMDRILRYPKQQYLRIKETLKLQAIKIKAIQTEKSEFYLRKF